MNYFWSFFVACLVGFLPIYGEQTLSILKPNVVQEHHIGEILSQFEKNGLQIIGLKMVQMNQEEAGRFYETHREKPFFQDLVTFMSSGPVVLVVLEGDNAVAKNRELMGATDPKKAKPGTLRALYGKDITANGIHGSDSAENAKNEIDYFFEQDELFKIK